MERLVGHKRKELGWLLGFLGFLILGSFSQASCRHTGEHPQVSLRTGRGEEVRVRVEVVTTPQERARGLMFRRHLAADAGMLFVYPSEAVQSFWMKNTYLALDLLFIGANKRVVGILQEAKPLSLQSLRVEAPSRYVLEVPAGFVKQHQVREGDRVDWIAIRDLS